MSLADNGIADIASLAALDGLSYLILSDNDVADISPLAGLTGIQTLTLDRNDISDVSPLSALTGLAYLDLDRNDISDIAPLAALTGLGWLYLAGNDIADISALAGLTGLGALSLAHNDIAHLVPMTDLALTDLSLGGNQIADLGALATLTELATFWAPGNAISDVADLGGLGHLGRGRSRRQRHLGHFGAGGECRVGGRGFRRSDGNPITDAGTGVGALRDRGVEVVVELADGYARQPLIRVAAGEFIIDGYSYTFCVVTGGDWRTGAVSYRLATWKWQTRSPGSTGWVDIPGTEQSEGDTFCPYRPTAPGEYRLVMEMSVDGVPGRYASNIVSL